jgi:hypothetical protein
MAGSGKGWEEGLRFEFGEAGRLSGSAGSSKPNLAILTG